MLNSPDTYSASGKRAASALNQKDIARYNFEANWARRAIALESEGAERNAARAAYDAAFTANRNTPRVEYFR